MHNDRTFQQSVMIMDSKPDRDESPPPPSPTEGVAETARRKRIRHAWQEAPHAHDAALRWMAWLLMVVLIIVAYVAVHHMMISGR